MENPKLNRIALALQRTKNTIEDYYAWIKSSIEGIILYGELPTIAFKYLIGSNPQAWQSDLSYIFQKLSPGAKILLQMSLTNCIRYLDISEADHARNNPGENEGRNNEHLALVYIGLIREFRATEALQQFQYLIKIRLPKSKAVYDAALLTWRIMSGKDPQFDPIIVFCDPNDFRYQPKYSAIIALGLCVTNPNKTHYYLEEWPPLQEFLHDVVSSTDPLLRKYAEKLLITIRELQAETPHLEKFGGRVSQTAIATMGYLGTKIGIANQLKESASTRSACRNIKPRRQTKDNRYSNISHAASVGMGFLQ